MATIRARPRAAVAAASAVLAVVLVVASAGADEDDPFASTSTVADPPPLPPLPELPPLAALPPLGDVTPTPTPARAPTPAPAPAPARALTPALISLPASPAAVLGQYDEYRRAVPAYSIDASPVTVADYRRCVAAGRCTPATCAGAATSRFTAVSLRPASASPDARVTCVDLQQATAYCAFAGARLPTEDEWEHAARASGALGDMKSLDDASEWTASPYCYFCNRDEEVVRGGPARNPALRGWRAPGTRDAALGFRCAR